MQNPLWVAKALMSSYILCKNPSCTKSIQYRYIRLIFIGRVNCAVLFQYRTDLFVAPSETELLMHIVNNNSPTEVCPVSLGAMVGYSGLLFKVITQLKIWFFRTLGSFWEHMPVAF